MEYIEGADTFFQKKFIYGIGCIELYINRLRR